MNKSRDKISVYQAPIGKIKPTMFLLIGLLSGIFYERISAITWDAVSVCNDAGAISQRPDIIAYSVCTQAELRHPGTCEWDSIVSVASSSISSQGIQDNIEVNAIRPDIHYAVLPANPCGSTRSDLTGQQEYPVGESAL